MGPVSKRREIFQEVGKSSGMLELLAAATLNGITAPDRITISSLARV
jgi:hypothetical protein